MVSRKSVVVVASCAVVAALAAIIVLEALINAGYLVSLNLSVVKVFRDWGGYVVEVKVVNDGLGDGVIKYVEANGLRISDLGVIAEVPNQNSLLLRSLGNESAAGTEVLISEIPLIKKEYPSWRGLPINSTYGRLVVSERVKVIKLGIRLSKSVLNLSRDYRGVILLDTYFWNVYRGPESFTFCRALFRVVKPSVLQAVFIGYFRGWGAFRVINVSTVSGINFEVPHTLTIEVRYVRGSGLVIEWLVDGELVGKLPLSNVIELVMWDVMCRWYPRFGYLADLRIDDLEVTLYKGSVPLIYIHAVYEEPVLPNYVVFPTGYRGYSVSPPGLNALHHVTGAPTYLVPHVPTYLYVKLPSKYFRGGEVVRLRIELVSGKSFSTEFKLP